MFENLAGYFFSLRLHMRAEGEPAWGGRFTQALDSSDTLVLTEIVADSPLGRYCALAVPAGRPYPAVGDRLVLVGTSVWGCEKMQRTLRAGREFYAGGANTSSGSSGGGSATPRFGGSLRGTDVMSSKSSDPMSGADVSVSEEDGLLLTFCRGVRAIPLPEQRRIVLDVNPDVNLGFKNKATRREMLEQGGFSSEEDRSERTRALYTLNPSELDLHVAGPGTGGAFLLPSPTDSQGGSPQDTTTTTPGDRGRGTGRTPTDHSASDHDPPGSSSADLNTVGVQVCGGGAGVTDHQTQTTSAKSLLQRGGKTTPRSSKSKSSRVFLGLRLGRCWGVHPETAGVLVEPATYRFFTTGYFGWGAPKATTFKSVLMALLVGEDLALQGTKPSEGLPSSVGEGSAGETAAGENGNVSLADRTVVIGLQKRGYVAEIYPSVVSANMVVTKVNGAADCGKFPDLLRDCSSIELRVPWARARGKNEKKGGRSGSSRIPRRRSGRKSDMGLKLREGPSGPGLLPGQPGEGEDYLSPNSSEDDDAGLPFTVSVRDRVSKLESEVQRRKSLSGSEAEAVRRRSLGGSSVDDPVADSLCGEYYFVASYNSVGMEFVMYGGVIGRGGGCTEGGLGVDVNELRYLAKGRMLEKGRQRVLCKGRHRVAKGREHLFLPRQSSLIPREAEDECRGKNKKFRSHGGRFHGHTHHIQEPQDQRGTVVCCGGTSGAARTGA